ncbi:corticotropin-releasing factor-binding protein [Neodiprion fabricii]|uniref:corticotropin-releasing factor-binding protein n=1 Tax=Neodiprion fabricii TaxID=2872261 RepID=UPI001ED94D9D|nr:corticotropin-releasing factor-binding protein [Neodiprion fabricii]
MFADYSARIPLRLILVTIFGVFVSLASASNSDLGPRLEQQLPLVPDVQKEVGFDPHFLEERGLRESRETVHFISDCMHVASEPGHYVYKSPSNDQTACGVYFLTDPDRLVELHFTSFDVPCDRGGLVSFVDGWELNGEVFPSAADHPLSLDERLSEFCERRVRKVFLSSQNAALIQYKIPQKGRGFSVMVRFPKNPNPCNILVDSLSDLFTLRNYGRRVNCTLSAMYPAVVRVIALGVGIGSPRGANREMETGTVHQCDKWGLQDHVQIGGSDGLDSTNLLLLDSICGVNSKPEGIENVMGCGVTSVRLVSSGLFDNSVTVAVRPATENDIIDANLICGV